MEKNDYRSVVITVLLAISSFLLLDLFFFFSNLNNEIFLYKDTFFPVFFSVVIFSLLFAILKKSSKALKICYIIVFLLGMINFIKINIVNEPFYLSDIAFINKLGSLIDLITHNISKIIIIKMIVVSVVYGSVLILLYILGKKNEKTFDNKKKRIRIIIIDIVILIALFFPTAKLKNLYLKYIFYNDQFLDYSGYGTSLHYYSYYSCTKGTYGIFLNNKFSEPDGYDDKELEKELDICNNLNDEKFLGTPNIIIILSESFWDIDNISEIEFDKKITSNFNKIKEEQYCVNLVSPVYGGMSENVTFELLTGGNLSFFPKGYIPITWLYNRKRNSEIPSLINLLKKSGYYAKITFVEDFYNSEKAFKKIGFDEYEELYSNNNQINYNDKYLTDIIINDLNNSNGKTINVYSTYENHMPYNEEKYDSYDISILNSKLSEEDNNVLKAYAQGIYNSDIQLGRLYEYVQNIKEPTIVLFLGDHLPYFYNSNYTNIINRLDYFNTSDKKLNTYRKFNTECLIFSNYDMKDFNISKYLGIDQLFSYIVNRMNVEKNNYYKWIENTSNIIAGFNRYIILDKDGKLYLRSELTPKMLETYIKREMMQYKFFIK